MAINYHLPEFCQVWLETRDSKMAAWLRPAQDLGAPTRKRNAASSHQCPYNNLRSCDKNELEAFAASIACLYRRRSAVVLHRQQELRPIAKGLKELNEGDLQYEESDPS